VGICTPESCSLIPSPHPLPPSPTPLETLEVMCSHRVTLDHQTTRSAIWGAARKS
jgi:hypothetical protein